MATTPTRLQEYQQPNSKEVAPGLQDEDVVISGMSGLFPSSRSVKEFSKILYKKVNPVTSDGNRWTEKHHEASEYVGKVPGIDRFDAQFFMVHYRLCMAMDPMARKILEQAYQAIYDAGLSPKDLNGKNVGVFIGAAFSDTENRGVYDNHENTGYAITGCSKTMYANRISYWLNAKGPSVTIDDACCGSMVALEQAVSAIRRGACEAAIVGGTNLCIVPHSQVHYNRCIKISPDGKTRSFDEHANGCTKSEAISVMFLQKAKHALRAYAEIIHVKNEFISKLSGETGQVFGFIRNPNSTAEFMKQFYVEAGVSPQEVKYIEACGSATPEADKAELQAIEEVFCENRTDPLLVGSVISNVGFTDAASGVTAVTKVLLGYHRGLIASNLHCDTPRQDIPAIQDGRMRVVTKHQPFRGSSYAAVNCLSVTGVNSHLLLRGYTKTKDLTRYKTSIPRLVTLSARQKEHLPDILEDLKSRPIDAEELALLHNIHSNNISGHLGRGYIILDTDDQQDTISLSEKMDHSEGTHRPLWFVYSGMGSQWAGMGAQLMRIPIFAAAIERCRNVLEPKGIDIVHIITSQDKSIFDNVLNSFVGIAAIQIGLTDLLTALGLFPENIIGHSVGELGCAYADGCLTAEETILSAYSRGKASTDTPLIRGAMAAVGLGYQQISERCPPEIEIACRNSSSSCTISGPEKAIREFIARLMADGVFAKEVPSGNIAYHSSYIADSGPILLQLLSEIIQEPRARSERWLSTSVPQERWNEPIAKYCSPEYLANNLLSPVYFEETSTLIPNYAVLIEIAPHGLLQAILKRSLPASCTNIPLTQRAHRDSAVFFLEAIGKLYVEGYTPLVSAIYPKTEFPVSTGTPHLAHFVKWYHMDSWYISGNTGLLEKKAFMCNFLITTHEDEYIYLNGNFIQGKMLYPFAASLVAVWDTLSMALGCLKKTISVRFHDVLLYSQPILHDQKQLKLNVSLQKGSGRFEVLEGYSKVATGYIVVYDEKSDRYENQELSGEFLINADELYHQLSSRGYGYREQFRSIHCADESLTKAQILWNDNWVTLIDGLIQFNTLQHTYEGILEPTGIKNLIIDIKKHIESIQRSTLEGKIIIETAVNKVFDYTRCGGVLLKTLLFRDIPFSNQLCFKLKCPTLSLSDKSENTISLNTTSNHRVTLRTGSVGNLESLLWEEAPPFTESGVEVTVAYAGVNILDVKRATGSIPFGNNEMYYGMDFSGLTDSGERVMGLVRNGAASTVVLAQPELLWPVPAHWSLEEAATVPLAYMQALYYLCVKNKLKHRWNVLIHGGAGALGQAAISVALARGCHVFTTVADNAKKRFLLELFPQLNANVIGNSRDASFGDMVLNATNGAGCDIVICSVREDLKNVSLNCTGLLGVTIDISQIQNRDVFVLNMSHLSNERAYATAEFYTLFNVENRTELKELQMLLSDGISLGHVRPLSRVTFAPHEAPRAFRLLAASRHRGRVLLRMKDSPVTALAHPRVFCLLNSTHLIVWDGSSLGLQLVDRLIAHGATKLCIYCLHPFPHLLKLRYWKSMGIDVEVLFDDKSVKNDSLSKTINNTIRCGPIEGLYVIATRVVSDGKPNNGLSDMVAHLDTTTRKLCPLLKYFAVVDVESNIGEQTCLSRHKSGFPATALTIKVANKHNAFMDESSWNRSAVDAIEAALRCRNPVVSAELEAVEETSFAKLLSGVDGNKDSTLTDLGFQESLFLIRTLLRDVYHVTLDDEDILKLTQKKLLEIEENSTERKLEQVEGLRIYFSHDDVDELQATMDFTSMQTLVSHVVTLDGAIDSSKAHLLIIPGLEGHHARFRTLCEHLKLPAFVLQPGLDHPDETPQELAIRYFKVLLEKFKLKTYFYLLGYECGIFVALELASILEEHGLTGTVFCIGDGPDEMKAVLSAEMAAYGSDCALQEGVVRHMFGLMARGSAAPVERALRGCSSWRARVDACVRTLLGRVSHSAQYARALVEAAYARIGTARRYSAAPRALRSRLVLLRARRHRAPASTAGDECSLQRYSQRALVVRDLAAPMPHAAADLRAPAIINAYLDEHVLQLFDNTNLCESYLYK